MEDLKIFAAKFKQWRGERKHIPYPSHFWKAIKCLIHHHGVEIVAKTLGINPSYLRHKVRNGKQSKSITFAPLQVTSLPCSASIEFVDKNAKPMTIRFQVDSNQLIQIIHSLSGNQK